MSKRVFFALIMIALSFNLTSCLSDDEDRGVLGSTTSGQNLDGIISSQDDPDLSAQELQGDIIADITLTAAQTWTLSGPLAVKAGATLTIEPGTRIEAISGLTNVFVVVEMGATIIADGTASDPIRFTSSADNPRGGDWGGVLVLGAAPISGGGTSTTEVLPLPYGGTNPIDNSGILDYVVIEFTGSRINGEREFNGLTLYGVGSETQVSNIVINKGDDDGIEMFGGTVSIQNLLVVDSRDDLFDWTQGWISPNNSNFYGVRTLGFTAVSEDTRGIEGDGNLDGNSPNDAGQSNVGINNITIVNNGIIEFSDLVKIRRGSTANLTNLYLGFNENNSSDANPSASDTIDLNDSRGDATATTSISGTVNVNSGVDINDIKNAPGATITLTPGNAPSVDRALFDWANIDF